MYGSDQQSHKIFHYLLVCNGGYVNHFIEYRLGISNGNITKYSFTNSQVTASLSTGKLSIQFRGSWVVWADGRLSIQRDDGITKL